MQSLRRTLIPPATDVSPGGQGRIPQREVMTGGGSRGEVFRKPAGGGASTGDKTMKFRMGVRWSPPGRAGPQWRLKGNGTPDRSQVTECVLPSLAWVQPGGLLQADARGPPPLQRVLQPTSV